MPEFDVIRLLGTETMSLRNIRCAGMCRHRTQEESTSTTHLVFAYRGIYIRHVGKDQAVADSRLSLLCSGTDSRAGPLNHWKRRIQLLPWYPAAVGPRTSHECRATHARRLLADRVGFSSHSHFSAALREAYGRSLPPSSKPPRLVGRKSLKISTASRLVKWSSKYRRLAVTYGDPSHDRENMCGL
jgi:AraC-like DNA-binding protein